MFTDKRINFPFWLFTFSVIIFLVIAELVKEGVFMDGMLYVSVGKNLSDGLGTFWHPHFSQTTMTHFHEQPPLYFGILSLFYYVLGDAAYVERFFGLICLMANVLLIHKIWIVIFRDEKRKFSWIPVLLWITIPVCFWSYANLVEENLMSVFDLLSIYFILKAFSAKRYDFVFAIISSLMICLAVLTKGPQGSFPLVSPLIYAFCTKKISLRNSFRLTGILFLVFIMVFGLFCLYDHNLLSFQEYFQKRILSTFEGVGSTAGGRFDLMIRLFSELIPSLGVSLLVFLFLRKRKNEVPDLRLILFMFLLGLSASVPLMVTLEQRGFYLVTSFPYFALGFSIFIVEFLKEKLNVLAEKKYKILLAAGSFFFISSIIYSGLQAGDFKRDEKLLKDIHALKEFTKNGDIVSIPPEMWNDWALQTYLVRYNYVSLAVDKKHNLFLLRNDLDPSLVPADYSLFVKMNSLSVYRLK